jgi:hypothetical protein
MSVNFFNRDVNAMQKLPVTFTLLGKLTEKGILLVKVSGHQQKGVY